MKAFVEHYTAMFTRYVYICQMHNLILTILMIWYLCNAQFTNFPDKWMYFFVTSLGLCAFHMSITVTKIVYIWISVIISNPACFDHFWLLVIFLLYQYGILIHSQTNMIDVLDSVRLSVCLWQAWFPKHKFGLFWICHTELFNQSLMVWCEICFAEYQSSDYPPFCRACLFQ